jgi:hypothetical protein
MASAIRHLASELSAEGCWIRGVLARDREGAPLESSEAIRTRGVSFSLLGAIEATFGTGSCQRAVLKAITEACELRGWGSFLIEVNNNHSLPEILGMLEDAAMNALHRHWVLAEIPELPDRPPTAIEYYGFSYLLSKLETKETFHWGALTRWGNITPTLREEANAYIEKLRVFLAKYPATAG